MPTTIGIVSFTDKSQEIVKALKSLSRQKVLVGIPQSEDQRPGSPIGNAALGYIHEFGSPAQNIPPRPWLIPSVNDSLDKAVIYLEQAAKHAFSGNSSGASRALNAAGQYTVNKIKTRIRSKIPPPLAPATVRNRINKNPSRKRIAARRPLTAADFTPLIDTAQLINSITYVVTVK